MLRRMERNEVTEPLASLSILSDFDRQFGLLELTSQYASATASCLLSHSWRCIVRWGRKTRDRGAAETQETGEPDAKCAHLQVAGNSKAKKT